MSIQIITLILAVLVINVGAMNEDPTTVEKVDLKKYAGKWFEIAKYPNSFQKSCSGETSAEYSLMDNGEIKVINSCSQKDGSRDQVEGVAKVVDSKTNAKLKVSFFSILGIRPFWGDYWIIGLGKNYEYAVVVSPNRKYCWILSRTKKMPDNLLAEAKDVLKKNQFDISKLVYSPQ